MANLWKPEADMLLSELSNAVPGETCIFRTRKDREWFETFLLRAVTKVGGARYHSENVQRKVDEVKKTYSDKIPDEFDGSKLKVSRIVMGVTRDAGDIAFEIEAFLVACRSALDFVARMFVFYDSGFAQHASINDLIKHAEKDTATVRFGAFLLTRKDWIRNIRGFRDAYTHYRTLRSVGGFKTIREGNATAHAVIPFVISERVLPDETDTMQSRMMREEDELPGLGVRSSRVELEVDGKRTLEHFSLEYSPMSGFVPVEEFCKTHLERLETFLRDAIIAMRQQGFASFTVVPNIKTCAPSTLVKNEVAAFVGIVKDGGAVAVDRLRERLLAAERVAIVSAGTKVLAVGAIKSYRPDYALTISRKSGFELTTAVSRTGLRCRIAIFPRERSLKARGEHIDRRTADGPLCHDFKRENAEDTRSLRIQAGW